MKKYILVLILFVSCNTNKRDRFSYNDETIKEAWITAYKYEVFYGCIKEGLGNDSLRIILKRKDLFNKNLEIDFNSINKARSVGQNVIIKMPKPYIKIDNDQDYLKDKNFISYNCLKYYASQELDSLANIEYNLYIKSKK